MSDLTDTASEHSRNLVTRATDTARAIKRYDNERADFPGEHIVVLAAGIFLLWGAGRRRSVLAQMAMTAAGTALLGLAASGRGGVAKIAGLLASR
jgi:hypothetical protein